MRILVVNNLYPPVALGGYERRCAAVVDHLRSLHDVLVLTSDLRAGEAPDAGVLRALPFVVATKPRTLLAPIDSVRAAQTTRRVLADFAPDLIYIWNGASLPQVAIAVLLNSPTPVVFNVGDGWLALLFGLGDPFTRRLATPAPAGARRLWTAAIAAINRHHPALRIELPRSRPVGTIWISRHLQKATVIPPYVRVLKEAVILPFSPHAERFRSLDRAPVETPGILYFGRVAPEKGVELAIDVVAALRARRRPNLQLVIAGPIERGYDRRIRAHAQTRLPADAVAFLGALSWEELAGRLQSTTLVIVPSVWDEPGGLVCLEAAAARVPIVASSVGGIPEIVHDREHALLFPRGDVEAAIVAVEAVLQRPADTAARVVRAFARSEQLGAARYLDATDRFLEEFLEVTADGR